jgi:hypothetical protein
LESQKLAPSLQAYAFLNHDGALAALHTFLQVVRDNSFHDESIHPTFRPENLLACVLVSSEMHSRGTRI